MSLVCRSTTLLVLLLAATLGCGQSTPAPAKATPAANVKADAAFPIKPAKPTPVPADQPNVGDEKAEPATVPEQPEPLVPAAERVAILTPGGPLLIDVRFTVDGHAHTHGVDAQLDQLIAAADTNDDKRATWKELLANDEFLKTPLANAANATGQQKYQWANQYDLNDNDLV